MKIIVAIVALLLSLGAAGADDGQAWIHPLPEGTPADAGHDVPKDRVFEVVASKERAAVLGELQTRRYVSLEDTEAQYYTGPYFKCGKDEKPYLVRAIYQNGGTGAYMVRLVSGALVVVHGSLGRPESMSPSALVVCLARAPLDVYNQLVGAE